MKAGALDRRVTIERYSVIQNAYGEEIESWSPLATVSAQVIQQSGREFLAADALHASVRVLFRLRWIEGVRETDRVIYGDRQYDIQEVRELGRREGLELMAVAAV